MCDFIVASNDLKEKNLIGREYSTIISLGSKWWLYLNCSEYQEYILKEGKVYLLGDVVGDIKNGSLENIVLNTKGCFYLVAFINNILSVSSCVFSILPVYYSEKSLLVSSSLSTLKQLFGSEEKINKRFILETTLFNYPFFNHTIYQGINLLPANSILQLDRKGLKLKKILYIEALYSTPLKYNKKVLSELAEQFISLTDQYIPKENSVISFTGGFDGRTLVSCGLYHRKKFTTFSFGKPENDDVYIPRKNADEIGVPYQFFDLGSEEYIQKEYSRYAYAVTRNTGGLNGYLYPHFLYAAKRVSQASDFMITGYCGSELFRAAHITGAITSKALFDVFNAKNEKALRNLLYNSQNLSILELNQFKTELEDLTDDIILYKQRIPNGLNKNQQLYLFVFEEIFRKVFGHLIKEQFRYIKVRVPYLDLEFIKALLGTDLAGVNNDFFTNNPLKRFKGQLLYAEIIRKTNPVIYQQITGKGYKPSDLLEFPGKLNIFYPFLKKRIVRKIKRKNLDNLGIISGVQENRNDFKNIIRNDYFNNNKLFESIINLTADTHEYKRDTILNALSISQLMQ